MLKTRILTALVLAPAALAAIFLLSVEDFRWFILGLVVLSGWEWANFIRLGTLGRWLYGFGLGVLLYTTGDLLQMWMVLAGLWWLIALALILKFPEQPEFFKRREILAGLGVIALVPCGVSLNVLKSTPQAESLIVLLLMLIWSADIGAYFVGRRFGQRKLLPAVSPGKSVEGLFGGLAVTLIVGLLLTVTVAPIAQMPVPAALWGFVFVVIALVSVLGDLTLSMFKRIRGIKDSSQLLPGHGGILDRLDSLYSSAPLFAVLVTYLAGQA